MAHRFNVFSGLDRHINKKNKSIPVNHEPDNNRITPEQIKDIVSREVNAASTRSQMMNYFDSIAASSERTETMLVELRDALDAGNFRSYKEEKLYNMGQIDREKEMSGQKKFY